MLRLRQTSCAVLVLALVAVGLAACGSSNDSASAPGQDATKVLRETFGGSKSVKSGQLGLTVAFKGKDGKTSSVALSGPFAAGSGTGAPTFDLTLAAGGEGQSLTVGSTFTRTKGFVTISGTSYALDADSFAGFTKGFEKSQRATSEKGTDTTTLSKLGIDPLRWLSSPKIEGTTESGGVKTIHVVTGVKVAALLDDVNRVLSKAGDAGLPSAATENVPTKLTAAQMAKVEEAIGGAKVDVFTGKDDKALRRMVIAFDLTVPQGEQIYGMGSGHVTVDFAISDLNQPQTIVAPKNAKPFSELQDQLKGLMDDVQGSVAKSSGGDAGADAASSKYLACLQKAGSDLAKVQKCASLVGQ